MPSTTNNEVKIAKIQTSQIRAHSTNVRRDLGDLRDLCDSIERFGIMDPIHVEKHPDYWLLRDGLRRHTVATMLGIPRMTAIIHPGELDDDEWLVQAVHHNHRRRKLDQDDKTHAVKKMRQAGMTWAGIAREFDVSQRVVKNWIHPNELRPRTRKSIGLRTLDGWATAWQNAVERGDATADEALAALRLVLTDGRFSEHYPPDSHRLAS